MKKKLFFLISLTFVLMLNQSEAQTQQQLTNYKNSLTNETSQLLLTAEGQPHVVVPKFHFSPSTLANLESNSTRLFQQVKPSVYQKVTTQINKIPNGLKKNRCVKAGITLVAGAVWVYDEYIETPEKRK